MTTLHTLFWRYFPLVASRLGQPLFLSFKLAPGNPEILIHRTFALSDQLYALCLKKGLS